MFEYSIRRLKNGIKDNERFVENYTRSGLENLKAVKQFQERIEEQKKAIIILSNMEKVFADHFYVDGGDLCDWYLMFDESISQEDIKDEKEAKELLVGYVMELLNREEEEK